MTDKNIISENQVSEFFQYIKSRQKITLLIALSSIVSQFAIFKYFYPYPDFIHDDSFWYLEGAFWNVDISIYLIGYSKFLRFLSVFFTSDILLTFFQYLLIECSALLLISTLFFFFNLNKTIKTVVFIFIVYNPLFLYLGNLISSDGFFLSISLIWLTLLIWILKYPSVLIIILNSALLLIAFTVRYNALIYPAITLIFYIIAKIPLYKKIIGLSTSLLFCMIFVSYTSYRYKAFSGIRQFSPFSGWQLANNALYAYREVKPNDRIHVPEKFSQLDRFVQRYIDTTRDLNIHIHERATASTIYMWDPRSPLYIYQDSIFKTNPTATRFQKWAHMAPLYKDYGLYIINNYKLNYFKYFVWPNANKFFAPPLEFLTVYNTGRDTSAPIAKTWFGYNNVTVSTRLKDNYNVALNFYPILTGTTYLFFCGCFIFYIVLSGYKWDDHFFRCTILIFSTTLTNAIFSIFASSIALRFQAFSIIITTVHALLLFHKIYKISSSKEGHRTTKRKDKIATEYGL